MDFVNSSRFDPCEKNKEASGSLLLNIITTFETNKCLSGIFDVVIFTSCEGVRVTV